MGGGRWARGVVRIVPAAVLALTLGACVTSKKDVQFLHDQIVALNSRVDGLQGKVDKRLSGDLEKRIDARLASRLSGGVEKDMRSVRETQATLVAEVSRLKQDVGALSGRVEDNDHLVRKAVERDTTEQDALRAQLAELNGRVARLEKNLERIEHYLSLEESEQEKKKEGKGPPSVSQPAVTETVSEADLYDRNLADYRQGKYEQALAGFRAFLKKYPKSELADNAQFWVGECYMALKQYEQAILSYQEVIKRYPKGNKVPNAMLRQALAFQAIEDTVSAKLILKRLVKKYSNSSEAKIAKAKLEKLR